MGTMEFERFGFIEAENVENANEIDKLKYTFVGLKRNKAGFDVYSFKERERVR